jgi:uncharacterized membrane protein YhaH (DUF805 family)
MSDGQAGTVSAFSFHGRINRSSFWAMIGVVFLGVFGIGILTAVVVPAIAPKGSGGVMPMVLLAVLVVVFVAAFWLSLATQVKRWHDLDKSGWMALLGIIPLVGLIVLIYLGVKEGTGAPNRFGAGPMKVGV